MIAIRDIRKSFDGRTVLDGVTFDVRNRETLVVLGKSGCGKSVLLKMIIGLLRPDSGEIIADSRNVVTMAYPELRSMRTRFGFLFQGAALFDSLTVGANVALGLQLRSGYTEEEIKDRVRYALALVGLASAEKARPADLSGGMKKRVGLARAIITNPRYMLYDEPTTGLDMETADGINRLINELRASLGVTSIVVTHDIHSAYVVGDRFVVLDRGRTLMTGTREELDNSTNDDVRKYITSSLSTSRMGGI